MTDLNLLNFWLKRSISSIVEEFRTVKYMIKISVGRFIKRAVSAMSDSVRDVEHFSVYGKPRRMYL